MKISLKNLIDGIKDISLLKMKKEKCSNCKKKLETAITGKFLVGKKFLCENCYYEKLGESVEQHPIVNPHVHRG